MGIAITLSVIILSQSAKADMFAAPNSQSKIVTKYFNRGQSFQFCWNEYDIIKRQFTNGTMCVLNDRGTQNISFKFNRSIAKVEAPEIVVRYNTLDSGLVDKTYPIAMDNATGGAVLINPEDKTDLVNALINSRDVIVFYKVDGSTEFQMAYYPLPIRDENGNVSTQEAQ